MASVDAALERRCHADRWPYSFVRTAGPTHLSLGDHVVTFATNGKRGLCIVFHEPVRAINPLGPPSHQNLTVTVDQLERLADALA